MSQKIGKSFYTVIKQLDELKKLVETSKVNVEEARKLFAGYKELTLYFYDKNLGAEWLELLDGAGEFKELGSKEAGIIEKFKADYLRHCAESKPEVVLGIIKKVKAKDAWVQGRMLDAILAMPEGIAVQGVPVLLDYFGGREQKVWYFVGKPAAKLMVKLVETHIDEAFELAWVLVDAWEATDEYKLKDMVAKFEEHDYEELIFKYYNKLFEVDAFKVTGILAKILERYVKEASKRDDYDVSSLFYIRMENLEGIDCRMAGILGILVKGICEGGKAVIEKQPDKIGELLDYLEGQDKAVFYRLEMHILRFASKAIETERKNRLIMNRKFLEEPGYEYEYKLLLRDTFDELEEKTVSGFIEWVKNKKVSKERRKEIEEWCKENKERLPDFEKMENWQRAEELYLVRDKFKDIYQEYVKKAGVDDESKLAPRRMVGEARAASPMEGTPLQPEEMAKRKVNEVLDFILEPKNYEGKKKSGEWREPGEALRATFKEDVKKRPIEYLKEGREKLAKLPAEFLSGFFYGISDKVRDGSFEKDGWDDLTGLAHAIVEEKQNEKVYRDCFSGILNALRNEFTQKDTTIEFNKKTIANLWGILETLVRYEEDYKASSDERDPVQMRCTSVKGEALEQVVMLGIVCKRDLEEYYEENLKSEIGKLLDYVVKEVRRPEVNCTFGLDMARIYYLDKEWLGKNIEKVFGGDMWDVVWGTYASWGRPSPSGFNLLVERGKYARAIELIGKPNKFKFGKDPEEGLVEHLMIGFFNDWIGLDGDLLKNFFGKASAELRGKAARFLTTGFKSVNEQGGKEKEKVAMRMREYWEKRIVAIKDKPGENKDEAIELTGWVEDSVLPAKETLELLEQSLDLSGGKIGKMRDTRDFVHGVCELGKGNELLALRCLKKAAADENMHMTWADIQEPLVKFLETMVESPENIKNEAREVADLYGRYNPDKFREVWEKLRNRQAT